MDDITITRLVRLTRLARGFPLTAAAATVGVAVDAARTAVGRLPGRGVCASSAAWALLEQSAAPLTRARAAAHAAVSPAALSAASGDGCPDAVAVAVRLSRPAVWLHPDDGMGSIKQGLLAARELYPPRALRRSSADGRSGYDAAKSSRCPPAALLRLACNKPAFVAVWNGACPAAGVAAAAASDDIGVRGAAAAHVACPVAMLARLAADPHYTIRLAAAGNPVCSGDMLDVLATDDDEEVRAAAVSNPSCRAETLSSAAVSEQQPTRAAAASNPSIPVELLAGLARDVAAAVAQEAAANPACPHGVLTALAHDHDEQIRMSVAANPSTPVETLEMLADDALSGVRASVADNRVCLPEILLVLSENPDPNVQTSARNALTDQSPAARLAAAAAPQRQSRSGDTPTGRAAQPKTSLLSAGSDGAVSETGASARSKLRARRV